MPTNQPVATRPLAIQINGTWYTYGWDLTKNICELYSTGGTLTTAYTYSPFGLPSPSGSLNQPIQWSSEVWDIELGLVYYNWRYYNTNFGRWLNRDILPYNPYKYCSNKQLFENDILGMMTISEVMDMTNPEYSMAAVISAVEDGVSRFEEMLRSKYTELSQYKCSFLISHDQPGGSKYATNKIRDRVILIINSIFQNTCISRVGTIRVALRQMRNCWSQCERQRTSVSAKASP